MTDNTIARASLPRTDATATARNPEDCKSSFTPIKRLAAEHQMKVLCIAVAIIVPLICLFFVGKAVRDARAPQTTLALDGSGVIHVGPLESLNRDSALFREIVLQIAQTHLNRNPKGLDTPELAERLYGDEALKGLKAEVSADATLFDRRNYFQQTQVIGIDPLEWGIGQKPRYRVKGYIERNGIIDGITQRDPAAYFRLSLELMPNPKLGERGQYPFKVRRYRLTWTNEQFEALKPETESSAP